MTKVIDVKKIEIRSERKSVGGFGKAFCKKAVASAAGMVVFVKKVVRFFARAAEIKRKISTAFVELSEELAEKTAREGLFGEDGENVWEEWE